MVRSPGTVTSPPAAPTLPSPWSSAWRAEVLTRVFWKKLWLAAVNHGDEVGKSWKM